MKIAVMGCGAMGSIYATLLATAGNEVICIDRNVNHVAAINHSGLRVTGASGERTAQVRAFLHPPEEAVDVLIIGLKAAHVESVGEARSMLSGSSTVVTIQNGLGSSDIVARQLGHHNLIVGVAQGFGAALIAPGHSHHNDMKAIRLGSYLGGRTEALRLAQDLFVSAGFDTETSDDIAVVQWEKLICNVAYSGPCALTGMTVGEMMADPVMGPVSRAAAIEAFEIAQLNDVAISVTDPVAYVQDFAARMPEAKPSVLLDIEAGRYSEIGVINGAVPREAEKVGAKAPVNATITALVQSLELRTVKVK